MKFETFQGELTQDLKERARYLADTYDFDANHARKIWCFGPNTSGPNMLMDVTQGISTSDIKDAICAGFQWVSDEVKRYFTIHLYECPDSVPLNLLSEKK